MHNIAHAWEVQEIVVPDVLGDFHNSLRLAQDFERAVSKDFKYIGVVQGTSESELVASLMGLCQLDYIDSIALPRHIYSIHRLERYHFAEKLTTMQIGTKSREVHFLGSTPWLKEPLILSELASARGMDTSMPVKYGLSRTKISETDMPYLSSGTVDAFFEIEMEELDDEQLECIRDNVRTFRNWCLDPTPSTSEM